MDNPIEIRVFGVPGPQGSKSHDRHGNMYESSAKVAPWRQAVWATTRSLLLKGTISKLIGPVVAEFIFSLPRPKSAAKRKYPHVPPDCDKLARSTGDALTLAGIYEDDSRIVDLHARKVYVGSDDPDSLPSPGAIIRLRSAI